MTLWIVRSLATFILAILVFVAFFAFLLESNFSRKLLDAEFYISTLQEQDAYNRLYDEVLVDEKMAGTTQRLLGNVQVVSHDEVVSLLREVMPPEYLQAQAEGAIENAVAYFGQEQEALEVRVDLSEPLANVNPVIFRYIDARIDQLQPVEPSPGRTLPEQIDAAQRAVQSLVVDLSAGRVPDTVPSIALIPQDFRGLAFDGFIGAVVDNASLAPRVRQGLEDNEDMLRQKFVEGDTKAFLKAAARVLVTPMIEDATSQVRVNLDDQGRLDLIAAIAQVNDGITEERLRADVADVRDRIGVAQTLGGPVALAVVIVGSVALGLIHLPNLSAALRWPGLVLLVTGIAFFVGGKIFESSFPGRLDALIQQVAGDAPDVPPSAIKLGTDIVHALGQRLVQDIGDPSLVLIIVGGVLLAGSFVAMWLRPSIPFFGRPRQGGEYQQSFT